MLRTVSYKELSAWIMLGACAVSGGIYALILNAFWSEMGEWIVPVVPFIAMTAILIVLSIFGHLIGALFMRSRVNELSDERDKLIRLRAGNVSGNILGISILTVLLLSMINLNGFFLFHAVFSCVLISQIMEYILQIVFYRRTSFAGEVS